VPQYQLLLQQDSLGQVDAAVEHFGASPHIYLVGTRPRISLKPDSFIIEGRRITAVLEVHNKDQRNEIQIVTEYPEETEGLEFTCDYPYTDFSLQKPDGQHNLSMKWSLFLQGLKPMQPELDFQIMYVGQAFGEDGERHAADRLRSHSTLQKIYSEAIQRNPDREVWQNLIAFQPPFQITMLDGHNSDAHDPEGHAEKFGNMQISWAHMICFAEAAMIRYFQPEYNQVFKNSFPSPTHSSYSECYELDLNSISVEFDSEPLKCTFSSNAVPADWLHMIQYPLHDREERVAMFERYMPKQDAGG